jgi:hypothetical protein
MTGLAATTTGNGPAGHAAGGASGTDRSPGQGPVIVFTYPHAGDELLTHALSASRSVACTHSTGLLPLCHAAITTWQNVENRETAPAPLAVKSVRSLVSTMAAVIQSGTGATRWCETASAGSAAAGTFLRIFPETTFLCLHRSLPAVIAEAALAYPWGLGGSPFWQYAAGHPGSNLATIAAYWAAHTGQLLDFEDAHPQSCLRVRHEDLAAQPYQCTAEIFARLGLDAHDLIAPGQTGDDRQPDADADRNSAPGASPPPQPPLEQVPSPLLARVSELHTRLGYEPLQP